MVNLIMDPNGEKVLESSSIPDSTFQKMAPKELNGSVDQLQENITLKQKVSKLEEKLTKVKANSYKIVTNSSFCTF